MAKTTTTKTPPTDTATLPLAAVATAPTDDALMLVDRLRRGCGFDPERNRILGL
jgi:hypothetical protein